MNVKEFDKVIMQNGKVGTLVDVSDDGTKGIVEDWEKVGGTYQLYDVKIDTLRKA